MPYISGISCNHYKYAGDKYTTPEVRDWMRTLRDLIYFQALKEGRKFSLNDTLKVSISGVFKDKRSAPDLHNLSKIINDSVEHATGINDKRFKTETDIPKIVKQDYGIYFFSNSYRCEEAKGELTIKIMQVLE